MFGSLLYRYQAAKIKKIHANHKKKNGFEYLYYEQILNKFHSGGGVKHGFQYYKLFELNQILSFYQPNSVLEFGSGSSSVIFSDYAVRNNCNFTSVDEDLKWLGNSVEICDVAPYDSELINFIQSKKQINKNDGAIEIKYEYTYDQYYDLVMVDGPSLIVDGKTDKSAVNTNVLDIINELLPRIILVDIRSATVDHIISKVGHLYEYTVSDAISRNYFEGYQYFTVFIKK